MQKPMVHGRSSSSHYSIESKSPLIEVSSLVIFALALFVCVALWTYHPGDPSLFTESSHPIQNACGRVGAYLSGLLFECVGIAAFLVPAALFFISASVFKREGSLKLLGTCSGMVVAVLSLTVFLTLQWKYWSYSGVTLLTGGAFGVWFADVLVKQLNTVGSSLVSLLVFSISIALSTPLSVAQWGGKVIVATYKALKLFTTQIIWRVLKLTATYFAFLLGLLVMKLAQGAAKGFEQGIESMMAKFKEVARARALKAEAQQQDLTKKVSEQLTLKKLFEKPEAVEPEIPAAVVNPVKLGESTVPLAPNALESTTTATSTDNEPVLNINSTPAILPYEAQKQQEFGAPINIPQSAATTKPVKKKSNSKRGGWKLPEIEFLVKPPKIESQVDKERLYQNAEILRQKFLDFEIEGEVTAVRPGPVITLYEFKPAAGVKVSRIAALADDISMALSAQSVRIIAPLPGKSVVGIEIPSDVRENVFMREFLAHVDFHGQKHVIPVAMGKDIAGNTYFSDLAKMPHILCAGQTGSGKSVFMNGLITSLLYRFTPDEMRFILVDPKMIEFASYQDIPHLLLPVVDDSSQAASALKWAVREMERRYRILAMTNVRNLAAYNQRVDEVGAELLQEALEEAEEQIEGMERMSGGDWVEAFEKDEDGTPQYGKLPYIVIVIDELADLMMTARKEVELSIARIAQKARAAGIHLVVATQRPSTDVITGVIKANLPSRVSFQLASGVDSKTILDRVGAERLLGRGDMFFIPPGTSNLLRLHGAYLSDDEINRMTDFLRSQGSPVYRNEILEDEDEENNSESSDFEDPMFDRAVELVKQNKQASASFIQRHLRVGYNRAARMIEEMEMKGIVGPADGARSRDVLIR